MCKWFRGIHLDLHSHLNSRASFQLPFQHSHCSFRNYVIIAILHCHPPTQRWNFSSLSARRRNVLVPGRNEFIGDTPKRSLRGARCLPRKWPSLPLRNIGFEPRVRTRRRGDARMFPSFSGSGFQWRACFLVQTLRRVRVRKRFPVSPVRGSGTRFGTQDTPKRFEAQTAARRAHPPASQFPGNVSPWIEW